MGGSHQDSLLLRSVLAAAGDAVILADANGLMRIVNPAACQLFQFTDDEMVGQSVNMLMPSPMADQHDGFMKHHIETGEQTVIGVGREIDAVKRDGTVFPVHITVGRAELTDEILFVGFLHDISSRRATQDALARSQRLEAIGQMTGGIAHDFNNLLTVVIGNLELLQMREPQPNQTSLIDDALDAAELGADITSRLTIFARKGDLKPLLSDISELCQETMTILKRTLGPKFRIVTKCAADLGLVMIDQAQLQSALINLVLNARDAMETGGKLLITTENISIDDSYIAQETEMELGQYVRLSVSDDGAGMDAEAQLRAFEPFFTTKADRGGTGLGLAMVYGFVRQSGGHITLYSEPGLGTSFGIYFPIVGSKTSGPKKDWDLSDPSSLLVGDGETVLAVEDNPKVLSLTARRLRDMGFVVEVAGSGDQALEMLNSGLKVDIVFSDLVMPGRLNGYDLARQIAVDFPDIRVLLTSGYASDVVSGSISEGQSFDILHKPYRQPEIARRLQALLPKQEGSSET